MSSANRRNMKTEACVPGPAEVKERPWQPGRLTEPVKARVHPAGPGDGAHQPGFEECRPFVGQAPQTTHIVLGNSKENVCCEKKILYIKKCV